MYGAAKSGGSGIGEKGEQGEEGRSSANGNRRHTASRCAGGHTLILCEFYREREQAWDFSLIFATLPPKLNPSKLDEARTTGTIPISAQLTVNFPPTLLPGLIRALTAQKELYEKTVGVELTEPKPKEPE